MFDSLKCKYPLPEHNQMQDAEFQTKDLGCLLDRYTITAKGRLKRRHASYLVEQERLNDATFTGKIDFYDVDAPEVGPSIWREYTAVFNEGSLISIRYCREREIPKE